MAEEISGIGVIAFANNAYWAVKLKPDVNKAIVSVYVPLEAVKQQAKSVLNGDFVQVTARRWTPGPDENLTFNGFTYKATHAKWNRHPQIIEASGKVLNIDPNGEFAYVDWLDVNGKRESIYCTRATFRPPSKNLNDDIKKGSMVNFKASEQPAAGNQNVVRFRSVIFTHSKYGIGPDNCIFDKTTKREIPGLTKTNKNSTLSAPSLNGSESLRGSLTNSGANLQSSQKPTNGVLGLVDNKRTFIPPNPQCKDEYEQEAEKLRQLSHALTGNRCNFCLNRRFDPTLKP